MGPERDLLTVSVGRGVNDLEAGQNDVPVRIEEDGARLRGSAAASCARADGRGVPPGVQPLAASANSFSEAFAPERGFASQASAFLRNITHGPWGRDVRYVTFGEGLVRHHVFPAARRVRKGGGESGRVGMPSFSAVRIDSSSRAPRAVVFEGGAARFGSDVPDRE